MEEIRTVVASDFQSVLKLNEAVVQQTSPMDENQLSALVLMADFCKVAICEKHVAAFVIALGEARPYENANYKWFTSRFPQFLYVDRIVVDSHWSGRKIGSRLYDDLFAFARSRGIGTITCEYSLYPLNTASQAFHNKFGFKQLGTQWIAGGTKQVSLQAATV